MAAKALGDSGSGRWHMVCQREARILLWYSLSAFKLAVLNWKKLYTSRQVASVQQLGGQVGCCVCCLLWKSPALLATSFPHLYGIFISFFFFHWLFPSILWFGGGASASPAQQTPLALILFISTLISLSFLSREEAKSCFMPMKSLSKAAGEHCKPTPWILLLRMYPTYCCEEQALLPSSDGKLACLNGAPLV